VVFLWLGRGRRLVLAAALALAVARVDRRSPDASGWALRGVVDGGGVVGFVGDGHGHAGGGVVV